MKSILDIENYGGLRAPTMILTRNRWGLDVPTPQYPRKRNRLYYADDYMISAMNSKGKWRMFSHGRFITSDIEIIELYDWKPFKESDTAEFDDREEWHESKVEGAVQWINSGYLSQDQLDQFNELIDKVYRPKYDPNGRTR